MTEVNGDKSSDEVDADARSPCGAKLHKVLKDVWLYEGRQTEREIQNTIISALPEDFRAQAVRNFLKIDIEGFVEGKNSVTPRCKTWRDVSWFFERGFVETNYATMQSSTQEAQARDHPHAHRHHHRTVFADVCKNVYELDDFGEFFTCAFGVVYGTSENLLELSPH